MSRSPGVAGFKRNGLIVPGPGVGTGPGFSGFDAPAPILLLACRRFSVLAKSLTERKNYFTSQAVGDDTRIRSPRVVSVRLRCFMYLGYMRSKWQRHSPGHRNSLSISDPCSTLFTNWVDRDVQTR